MSVRIAARKRVSGVEPEFFDYEGSIWRVTKIDGLGSPNIEVFEANKGFGNGSFITGKRQTSRQIDIEAVCQKVGNAQNTWRVQAQRYHSENWSSAVYDLYFQLYGLTGYSAKNCVLQGFKISIDNVFRRPTMTVSFLCPDSLLVLNGTTNEVKYPQNSQPDTYAVFSGFTKNPNTFNRYADRINIDLPQNFNEDLDGLSLQKGDGSKIQVLYQEGSILEGTGTISISRYSDGTASVLNSESAVIRHLTKEQTDALFYLPENASDIRYTVYLNTIPGFPGKFSSTSKLRLIYDSESREVMGV